MLVFGNNRNGQLGQGDDNNRYVPTLFQIDDNSEKVVLLPNLTDISPLEWNPEVHIKIDYPEFKKEVMNLLLALKRTQNETGVKIPRFVIYEMIKYNYDSSYRGHHQAFNELNQKGGDISISQIRDQLEGDSDISKLLDELEDPLTK